MVGRRWAGPVAIALSMFAIGYVLPSKVFLLLALVGILVASFAGQHHARQAGYWQAHVEIAAIMQRVLEGEKPEAQRFGELVDGIITQATAHLQERSVPWWRRIVNARPGTQRGRARQ